jgi:hypothetical protein
VTCEPRGLGGIRPEAVLYLSVRRRTACRGLHHGVHTYSQQPIETPPTACPYGGRALHGHERTGEGHGDHEEVTKRIPLYCADRQQAEHVAVHMP